MSKLNEIFRFDAGLCPPRVFVIMAALFLVFVGGAVCLSLVFDVPFVAPRERISVAIGVHYLYPFAIGVGGYLLLHLMFQLLGLARYTTKERLGHVLADGFFLGLFAGVIYFHFNIKMWMPLINANLYDEVFFQIDQSFSWLLVSMESLRGALAAYAPKLDHYYQVGFLAMFAVCLWSHALGNRRWHYHNMCALLLLEMIGAFSYLLWPAVGPFMFEQGSNADATEAQKAMLASFQMVQQEGAAWLREHGEGYFTGPPAAMPSLHVAGAFIMSWYIIAARSFAAPIVVGSALFILVESVVSRWHYLIDIPPGLLLGGIVIFLAGRICGKPQQEEEKPDQASNDVAEAAL